MDKKLEYSKMVLRGCSWLYFDPRFLRDAYRNFDFSPSVFKTFGFRYCKPVVNLKQVKR